MKRSIVDKLKNRRNIIDKFYVSDNRVVYTPSFMVERIFDEFPKNIWKNPNFTWCDPATKSGEFLIGVIIRLMNGLEDVIKDEKKRFDHIIKNMVYGYAVDVVSALISRKTIYNSPYTKGNIFDYSFIEKEERKDMKKFDIEVGNPPFQEPSTKERKGGSPKTIWPKFLYIGLDYLADGGYLALIHPCGWRKPSVENKKEPSLYSILTKYQIEWLEQHKSDGGRESGMQTFGVGTSFDCYVLHKVPYTKPTFVSDFSGKDYPKIDLREWEKLFHGLPSGEFELIKSMLVKDGEETWDVRHDSLYLVNRKTPRIKDNIFKYPIINTIDANGKNIAYANTNKRGNSHFGVPKVIISDGRHIYPIADFEGKYGMSQNAIGFVVKTKKEMNNLIAFLNSSEFKKVVWATKWGNFRTDWRMFKYFKKSLYAN